MSALTSNGYGGAGRQEFIGGGGAGGRAFPSAAAGAGHFGFGGQQQMQRPSKPFVRNTDPGVYEPEEDDRVDPGFTRYSDEREFFQELTESRQQLMQRDREADAAAADADPSTSPTTAVAAAAAAASPSLDLPLTGDYVGIGGPDSVPLSAPGGAFDKPSSVPHSRCLLDELFMAPSSDQIAAYNKVMMKREM